MAAGTVSGYAVLCRGLNGQMTTTSGDRFWPDGGATVKGSAIF